MFDPIRDNLDIVRREHQDFRWVLHDTLHITLAFLGEIDEAGLRILGDAVSRSIETGGIQRARFTTGKMVYLPFVFRRPGARVFPKKIRAIGLSIDTGAEKIQTMASAIEKNLVKIGSEENYAFRPAERRRYFPHITLARRGRNTAADCSWGAGDGLLFCAEGAADNITIFKSEIFSGGPGGQRKGFPRYTPLKVFSLAP
jgi:2'-5' RNA ligase